MKAAKSCGDPTLACALNRAKIGSPQDFAAFIAIEAPKWAALVRDSGAKLE